MGRGRRLGWVFACFALGFFTACSASTSDPGDDTGAGGGGTGDGSEEVDAGNGDVLDGEFVLAAPSDCVVNPFCSPGLRRTYGIDARRALRPTEPGEVISAVVEGAATVGVVFSADPAIALDDTTSLVVLEDDLAMVGAENLVPLIRHEASQRLGPSVVAALDSVSARLGTADVARLVAAGPAERAEVIAAWLDQHGAFTAGEGSVTFGAQAFDEHRAVSDLYAAALASAGFDTKVIDVEGFRPYSMDALVFGDVDVVVEYAASALEFLSGYQGVATSNVSETAAHLAEFAALRDIDVLVPSSAASSNLFVMESSFARELGVSRLSDLGRFLPSAPIDSPADGGLLAVGSGPDDLGVGFVGEQVVQLEVRLLELGYDPGPADGTFDQLTRLAVVAFQQCRGLTPDGVVGPATQDSLASDDSPACDDSEGDASHAGGDGGGVSPDPGPDGSPVLYFTFDDGPHPTYTPQILDLLAQYDGSATFWNIGAQVGPHAALVASVVDAGHVVGNHTWSHPDLTKIGRDQFFAEIDSTNEAIAAATGRMPTCLRPPYGARNATVDAEAAEAGLEIVLWDIDPQDWRRPGVDVIVDNVLEFARPGAIVLMHDGGGSREQTVEALGRVLPELSAQGYRFDALPCS